MMQQVKEIKFFEEEHAIIVGEIILKDGFKLSWDLPKHGININCIRNIINDKIVALPDLNVYFFNEKEEWAYHRITCIGLSEEEIKEILKDRVYLNETT